MTDRLGRELERNVGIPLVFFDVLIHVGGAPESRLTMSKLSADVALTTGGVTRLVDRMVERGWWPGRTARTSAQHLCRADTRGTSGLHRAVAEHIDGIDRHLVAHLDDRERAALEVALVKILDAG